MKTYEVTLYYRKGSCFGIGACQSYVINETSKSRAKEIAYLMYVENRHVGHYDPLARENFRIEANQI